MVKCHTVVLVLWQYIIRFYWRPKFWGNLLLAYYSFNILLYIYIYIYIYITPVYCLIFISLPLPRMAFVFMLNLVEGTKIRNVCPESSFFDTIELHKMGSWVRQSTIVCREFYVRHISCSEWTFIYKNLILYDFRHFQ